MAVEKVIKIKDEHLAELQSYWVGYQNFVRQGRELSRKLETLKAQVDASRKVFWNRATELYPSVQEGNWCIIDEDWTLQKSSYFETQGPSKGLTDLLRRLMEDDD